MMLRRPSSKTEPPPSPTKAGGKYQARRVVPLLAAAVACVLISSLFLQTTTTVEASMDVMTCQEQRQLSGRAAPGATLADEGHCVKTQTIDAGVCVADGSDWRGVDRRRCMPSLAVIGAMKSGTTNIMLYLQNHPNLRTSEDLVGWPQESRYFSAAHDPAAAGRNWRFYLRKYPASAEGVLTFDKSPNYLLNPKIPPVLASLMPSLKLLVCLRNPTSRAYSHLQHECRNGRVRQAKDVVYRSTCKPGRKACGPDSVSLSFPCAPEAFQMLVAAQLAEKSDLERCAWARGGGSGDSNVLPRGFYDCQLGPWFRNFPRSQLLALVFEDFVSSRSATLAAVAQVERFAGLDGFDYAGSRRVAAVERLYALMPSRRGSYLPMLPATRETLDSLYCAPNRALAATLGRPLPWPCGAEGSV